MALHRSRARLVTALAIVTLGSIAFGWTSAPAGGVASTVTIDYGGGKFSGLVQAASPCAAGRLVTVNKQGGGVVGSDTTDAGGAWEIKKKRAHGEFSATVAASTVPDSGYGYTSTQCDSDTSDVIKVKKKHKKHKKGGGGAFDLEKFFKKLKKLFPNIDFPFLPGF